MNSKRKKQSRNRQSGVGALEVATSSVLMVALVALALDVTILNFAAGLNDAACRDAARCAAGCNNSTLAISAANAQLLMHKTDGTFVGQPTLTSTSAPDFVYQDYAGSPPDTQHSPYLTVTTMCDVKVPCPILLLGASFFMGPNHTPGVVRFKRQYTFPIIKEKFYNS